VKALSPTEAKQMESEQLPWYLVRTKQYKERLVENKLSEFIPATFFPLLRSKVSKFGRAIETLTPLFPCYIFARFDLLSTHYKIQHTVGVIQVVCTGGEPSEVDEAIVEEIRSRGTNGIVERPKESYQQGQRVQVQNGPFSGLNAIFERYLSGSERVALLLSTVGTANIRITLPSARITHLSELKAGRAFRNQL
jgi:transcriptional antiterminator RfaH